MCRRCHAPLPHAAQTIVVACLHCQAANVLELDLRREAHERTSAMAELRSALSLRARTRAVSCVALAASLTLAIVGVEPAPPASLSMPMPIVVPFAFMATPRLRLGVAIDRRSPLRGSLRGSVSTESSVAERTATREAARAAPGGTGNDLPTLSFATPNAWSEWLAAHHASSRGVWLKIAKQRASGAREASVTYAQALEVALAWGWIDGQKGKLDEAWWLQRFTPRRAKSLWSKINCAKAEALIAAGAMQAPGLAEVERAKRDGRWERAYDGASSSRVPEDLAAAFARDARAHAFFQELDGANRFAILFSVQTAKKAATRAERIARFVAMCTRHETIHPPRPPTKRSRSANTKVPPADT